MLGGTLCYIKRLYADAINLDSRVRTSAYATKVRFILFLSLPFLALPELGNVQGRLNMASVSINQIPN